MKIIQTISSIVMIAIVLCSCIDHNSVQKKADNYFPLENETKWSYERRRNDYSDDLNRILDTLTFKVKGDTVVEGQLYKAITDADGFIEKIIRVEGSKYYGRSHELYTGYSKEYMFLDTEIPVDSSWVYFKDEGYITKTVYTIKAKNSAYEIQGKVYKNVIQVAVDYYHQEQPGTDVLWLTTEHYYAKNIGEIYNYYPYPLSSTYSNVSAFLID